MQHRRAILLAGIVIVLIASPAAADPWYEHYANARQALDEEQWTVAVEQLNAALEKKGDSGARVRSYGMNVVAYFPYFQLGVAYYHLGQFDASLQAFETEARLGAITESESANAKLGEYRALASEARVAQLADRERRIRAIVAEGLAQAGRYQDQGQIEAAIAAVDKALAVAPDDAGALTLMNELRASLAEQQRARVAEHSEPEAEEVTLDVDAMPDRGDAENRVAELRLAQRHAADLAARIEQLLATASSSFEAGSTEASLAAANQVLALDPGNPAALDQVARAYAVINRRLLGTHPGGNIPPALRFVDLREEDEEGERVQVTRSPDFRLTGIVIDESPVEISVVSDNHEAIEPKLNSQSIGDFYLTEFSIETALPPGRTSLWLTARDAEGMNSASAYAVLYTRPVFQEAWFQALVAATAMLVIAVPLWRGHRQRGHVLRSPPACRSHPADDSQQQPAAVRRAPYRQDLDPAPAQAAAARSR